MTNQKEYGLYRRTFIVRGGLRLPVSVEIEKDAFDDEHRKIFATWEYTYRERKTGALETASSGFGTEGFVLGPVIDAARAELKGNIEANAYRRESFSELRILLGATAGRARP